MANLLFPELRWRALHPGRGPELEASSAIGTQAREGGPALSCLLVAWEDIFLEGVRVVFESIAFLYANLGGGGATARVLGSRRLKRLSSVGLVMGSCNGERGTTRCCGDEFARTEVFLTPSLCLVLFRSFTSAR